MEVAPFFVDFHHFLSIFTIFYRFSRFTHFCRDLHFVAIYALFPQIFFGQNSLLRNITRFLHVCPYLIVTQYRQVPTIAVLYCPSTQLHHLLTHSQMDLVYKNVWKSSKLHGYTFLRYYLLIEYFFNEPLEYFFEIGWNVSHCEVVRRLATFWEKPIMIGWQGGISSNPFHHHVKGSTKK